jgi:hypothetical protein
MTRFPAFNSPGIRGVTKSRELDATAAAVSTPCNATRVVVDSVIKLGPLASIYTLHNHPELLRSVLSLRVVGIRIANADLR